jgi:NAD(P)H dehydrogenase (quinone)
MTKIIVVYHSGYGHTGKQAEAVANGARAELIAIDAEGNLTDGQWAALDAADAIVMGSPTYMGSVSWQFKKFADKLSTLHYLFTLAMQHSGIWVGTGLMPANTKAAQRNDINYVASFSGAMMQTPSDAGVDEVLPGDLETARLFGERVAKVTRQMRG